MTENDGIEPKYLIPADVRMALAIADRLDRLCEIISSRKGRQ